MVKDYDGRSVDPAILYRYIPNAPTHTRKESESPTHKARAGGKKTKDKRTNGSSQQHSADTHSVDQPARKKKQGKKEAPPTSSSSSSATRFKVRFSASFEHFRLLAKERVREEKR